MSTDSDRTDKALREVCRTHGTPLDEQSPCGEDIVLWASTLIADLKAQLAEKENAYEGLKFIMESTVADRDKRIGELDAVLTDAVNLAGKCSKRRETLEASLKEAREALDDIKDWADLDTMVRKAEVMERALELIYKKAKGIT